MSIPEQIGRYKIETTIGQGNMGCVYKAFDPNLQRHVAIKMLHAVARANPAEAAEFKNRFFQEAQVNSKLGHPNIVAIYDSGLLEEEPYLVMEFIEGRGLDALLRDTVIPALEIRLNLLEQIALGLEFAHRKGVVHRDIKPANMLVTNDLEIKIVDFGLAKLQDSNLTHTGVFLGTPSYSSPEQITGSHLDRHSDLFSFGLVAHEILFGRRPFSGQNINSILFNLVNSAPDLRMENLPPQADPEKVKATFERILAKDSAQRFHGALEFVNALERAYGVVHPIPVPTGSNSGSRSLMSSVRLDENISKDKATQDETLLLSDALKEPLPGEARTSAGKKAFPWRKFALPLGLGGAAVVGLSFFALYSPSQPVAKDPVKIASSPSASGTADVEIPAQSDPSDASSQTVLDAHNREQLRRTFFEFLDAGKLVEAENTLTGIEVLGANVDAERRALEMAKSIAKEKLQDRNEAARKLAAQKRIENAKKSKDLSEMERLFKEYQQAWPNDPMVLAAFNADLIVLRQQREKEILHKREAFNRALQGWNLEVASKLYRELEGWNAGDPDEKKELEKLSQNIWSNAFGMRFSKLTPGSFVMGRESKSIFSGPLRAHKVQIMRPIWFGMTEVTQAQWKAVMGAPFPGIEVEGDDLPISSVNYSDAQKFVVRLNELDKQGNYRLPTEQEWEYACRAGKVMEYQSGEVLENAAATFISAGRDFPTPVDTNKPNAWGLFDMHGNLWEWVYAGPETYPKELERSPLGSPEELGKREGGLRGGSFKSPAEECACSNRGPKPKKAELKTLGFRVVRQM